MCLYTIWCDDIMMVNQIFAKCYVILLLSLSSFIQSLFFWIIWFLKLWVLFQIFHCFNSSLSTEGSDKHFSLDDFGFLVFHSPYCKLVQKSLARLMLNDFLSHPNPNTETGLFAGLDAFRYTKLLQPLMMFLHRVAHFSLYTLMFCECRG